MRPSSWGRRAAAWLIGIGGILAIQCLQAQTGINPGDDLMGLAYGNGVYVLSGNSIGQAQDIGGVLYTSPDGTNWQRQAALPTMRGSLVFANGRFLAFSSYWYPTGDPTIEYIVQNSFLVSSNGTQWSRTDVGSAGELNRMAFGSGRFVAVGERGTILTSTDGLTWNNPSSHTDYNLLDVAYGNGRFVAVGENGAVLTSPDGLAWTNQYAGTVNTISGIAFENGRFLIRTRIAGESPLHFVSSNDGATWTNYFAAPWVANAYNYYPADHLYSGNGRFLWLDNYLNSDCVRVSEDGINWATSRIGRTVNNIVFCQGMYYGLAYGAYLMSPDGQTWFDPATSNRAPEIVSSTFFYTIEAGPNYLSIPFGVSGNPTPHCQWQFNGADIPYANGNSLKLWDATTNQAGEYRLIASNALGMAASEVVTVSVTMRAPVITASPSNTTALVDQSFAWYGAIASAPWAAIQWYFNGAPLALATNRTLNLLSVTPAQAGQYYFVASNLMGVATSAVATLSVTTAPPVFTVINYMSRVVPEGAKVGFSANCSGAPTPRLSLLFNGANLALPARFGNTFTILEATTNDSGLYAIVASNEVGSVTGQVVSLTVVPGGPLDSWRRLNPIPQGNNLLSVVYGLSNFVAVGDFGTILTSPDATNWTLQSLRTDASLRRVAYGQGQFIAVGASGTILGSADGRQWTMRQVEDPRLGLSGIAFGNDRFAAVTQFDWREWAWSPGSVWISTNGWDWTPANGPGLPQQFAAVAWGNNRFVAVSPSGDVGVSLNAVDWTVVSLGEYCQANCITYGKGRFVALGSGGRASVSGDGYSWTTRTFGSDRRFTGVAYGNNLFVGVATRGVIYTSPDGATWTARDSGTPDRLESVTFGNNLFVALGENGTTLTSPDGITWSRQNQGPTRDLDGMTQGLGLAVIVGKYGTILTTADGLRFALQISGVTNDLHGVGFGDGRLVAVGEQGTVLVSTNAVDWWRADSGITNVSLKRVAWGNRRWVAVGTGGTILTSGDGVVWAKEFWPTLDDFNEVAWGNGTFVIVGDHSPPNATILTSATGYNWTPQYLSTGKNMRAITFGGGRFMAVGNDGVIVVSTNGAQWTRRYSDFNSDGDNLRCVAYTNGLWIVAGNNGIIITSPDTHNWTTRAANTIENLHALEFFHGAFLTIGNRGNIFRSGRLHAANLASPRFHPQAGFSMTINPQPGFSLRLQSSPDLRQWTDVLKLEDLGGATNLVDAQALQRSNNFYRIISP